MDPGPAGNRRSLRILLVESHPGLCRGIKELLATYPEFSVLDTVSSVERAEVLVTEVRPDVVLIGLELIERSICEAIWDVKGGSRQTRVVVLALDALLAPQALSCGSDDFLVIGCSSEELVAALAGERVGPGTLAANAAENKSGARPAGRRKKP